MKSSLTITPDFIPKPWVNACSLYQAALAHMVIWQPMLRTFMTPSHELLTLQCTQYAPVGPYPPNPALALQRPP